MRPPSSTAILGVRTLAAGGFLWCGAAVLTGAWVESLFCGTIGTGFLLAAVGWADGRGVGPAGFGLAAAGTAGPIVLYGPGGPLWSLLSVALPTIGMLGVAAGIRLRLPSAVFAGFVAAAVGSAALVGGADVLRGLSVWTPGNVLAALGALIAAAGSWSGSRARGTPN
ncbi:MAG: hypothetical protein ACT4PT_00275 [Methanobacteriota archaeon]